MGQASSDTRQSSATSAAWASVDASSPVIAISARADALQRLQDARQFFGLAAIRHGDDHIVGLDDPKVAVHGFGGMQEERRRAGAREGRGDLAADDAGLAHAGDDDAAAAVADEHDGAGEPLVEAIDKRQHRGGFGLEDLAREGQVRHAGRSYQGRPAAA